MNILGPGKVAFSAFVILYMLFLAFAIYDVFSIILASETELAQYPFGLYSYKYASADVYIVTGLDSIYRGILSLTLGTVLSAMNRPWLGFLVLLTDVFYGIFVTLLFGTYS